MNANKKNNNNIITSKKKKKQNGVTKDEKIGKFQDEHKKSIQSNICVEKKWMIIRFVNETLKGWFCWSAFHETNVYWAKMKIRINVIHTWFLKQPALKKRPVEWIQIPLNPWTFWNEMKCDMSRRFVHVSFLSDFVFVSFFISVFVILCSFVV